MLNTSYQYVHNYERTQYDVELQQNSETYVTAKYIRSFDSADHGNRLIEALPPMRSARACVNDFVKAPCWTAECRKKSQIERMSMCSHLAEFKIPRDFTVDVDFEIYNMLLRCYRARIANACPGSDGPGFFKPTGEAIPGGLLIGNSGAGKTTAIIHALQYYPELIIHEMEDARMLQIPYINVLCPPDASVKGFYELCLNEIERITGNPITERHKRCTADTCAQIFRRQALRYNLGLVVVDEVQNIMNVQKKMLMQHFLNLSNELSVPFLFVGTDKVRDFFANEEFYIKRRTGVLIEASLFEKNEVWESFLQKLWKFQWTKEIIPYSQEFSDVFFEESAGNIDRVKELYLVAQKDAIKTGFDTVNDFTPQYIKSISHKYFRISCQDLNKKATAKQLPQLQQLHRNETFHKKEELKELIMNGASTTEKLEVLKYRIVENVGSFSQGKYSYKAIEAAFKRISVETDVLNEDEFSISMRVLECLRRDSDQKEKKPVKKSGDSSDKVERLIKGLPRFEGIGVVQ